MKAVKGNAWQYVTSNRLIANKEEKSNHEKHLRQLATIKPSVDNSSPRRYPHLKYRLKTREIQRDRAHEIQLENRILLQKMLSIDTRNNMSQTGGSGGAGSGNATGGGGGGPGTFNTGHGMNGKSLHASYQNRELERITKANRQLLGRLEKTQSSMGSAKRHVEEEKHRKKILSKINENSARWRRDLHLRVPPKTSAVTGGPGPSNNNHNDINNNNPGSAVSAGPGGFDEAGLDARFAAFKESYARHMSQHMYTAGGGGGGGGVK